MSSAKWWPFCLDLIVLTPFVYKWIVVATCRVDVSDASPPPQLHHGPFFCYGWTMCKPVKEDIHKQYAYESVDCNNGTQFVSVSVC